MLVTMVTYWSKYNKLYTFAYKRAFNVIISILYNSQLYSIILSSVCVGMDLIKMLSYPGGMVMVDCWIILILRRLNGGTSN